MGARRHSRELALQAMYLSDACGFDLDQAFKTVTKEPAAPPVLEFSRHLIDGMMQKREEIDRILSHYAENWELKRMATVDRNVLRLAALEIIGDLQTPVSVIIDEAIEIAKTYSTVDSGKFVNGILDKLKQERKNPSESQ